MNCPNRIGEIVVRKLNLNENNIIEIFANSIGFKYEFKLKI
jgi:hypothetical protein